MGYDNEHTEIIDIFEDISRIEEEIKIEEDKQKVKKQVTLNKKNKLLSTSITLIPIFSLMYIISRHSTELINERISIFSLIMIGILSFSLVFGIIKEIKIQRTKKSRILKFVLSASYISIFAITLFSLYGDNNLKYFLVDKAMSTTNHHYIATWFYDDKTITEVLDNLKDETEIDVNGSNKLDFNEIKEIDTIYANKYEEEILSNKKDVYKKIELKEDNYTGYILVIYEENQIELVTEITEEEPSLNEEINITEEITIPKNKNIISLKNNQLTLEAIIPDNQNYIKYKEVILKNDIKQNQENTYNQEIVIGQREDNIILVLVLEKTNNLTNQDITKILENYSVKDAVVSTSYNKIELSSTKVMVKNYEEN